MRRRKRRSSRKRGVDEERPRVERRA